MGSVHHAAAPLLIVILIAALASISLNIGKAVQKMKVEVLRNGRAILRPPYLRDFLIWCLGMSLTFVAGLLINIAQNLTDKPSIVSALNGVGLIGLALFAWLVLKEKVGPREWGSIGLIIAGTAIFSFFNVALKGEKTFSLTALIWVSAGATVLLGILLLTAMKLGRGHAMIFAAMAGVSLGLMNVLYHSGNIASGGTNLIVQLRTAYPYIGFMVGNFAFLFTNLAFFHGTGITIVPTVNSFMIVSPMLFEYFVFNVSLRPMQYVGAAVIVAGVIILTTGGAIADKTKKPAVGSGQSGKK